MVIDNVELNNGRYCNYDLIFMDCNMPFMDGYEATTQIREYLYSQDLAQPIISAITGHTEQAYIDKSILCGMNQVLSKPVQVEVLSHLIRELGYHGEGMGEAHKKKVEKAPSQSEIDILEEYIEDHEVANELISHSKIWKINKGILDKTSQNKFNRRST